MDSEATGPAEAREAQVVSEVEAATERSARVARIETSLFAGPLPPPSMLGQYNDVLPNGAERIMRMVEAQSQHRRELEAYAIRGDHHRSILGTLVGALVVGAMLVLAGYAISQQQQTAAMILGALPLVGVAGVFVYGTDSRRNERIQKAEKAKDK